MDGLHARGKRTRRRSLAFNPARSTSATQYCAKLDKKNNRKVGLLYARPIKANNFRNFDST
jgi:hypothetical protein